MSDKASYESIGKQITLRADLSQFSGRDKANLLNHLLDEADIRSLMTNLTPEEQRIINATIVSAVSRLWQS